MTKSRGVFRNPKGSFMRFKKLSHRPIPWFWIGIASLFLLSTTLRFWGLGRFNTLVFDEVYNAKFANNLLNHIPSFSGHPPLTKYLIAIGIWLGSHLPLTQEITNGLTGSQLAPWTYRWVNALTGSLIPLVVAGIGYQLTHRRSYALIAGLFAAADGLFLVESRYALTNVYLVLFGLLGQWCFLLALASSPGRRRLWLAVSGICFGASVAVKWNGLWFLLGAYLIWISAWVLRRVQSTPSVPPDSLTAQPTSAANLDYSVGNQSPLQRLTRLSPWQVLFNLGVIPVVVYRLAWIPYLQLYPASGFWELQKQILAYHQGVGSGSEEHPYCSSWYTWPWMIRPVGYFYGTAASITEPLPTQNSSLTGDAVKVVYDVHGMGNPILWWLSTLAILLLLGSLAQRIDIWATTPEKPAHQSFSLTQTSEVWVGLYLVLNYGANLLPWARITRCAFLYHYMGASIFAFLALAWIVDRWLHSYRRWHRAAGVTVIFLILFAFVYWLPIYLGLPLSPEDFRGRMWFNSWY